MHATGECQTSIMAIARPKNPTEKMAETLINKVKALVHELGIGTSVLYLFDKMLRRIPGWGICDYRFFAQNLSDCPRLAVGRSKKYELYWLSKPEPQLTDLGRPVSVILDRFSQGAQCLIAMRDGRLAGCIWYVRNEYIEDEVRVDFVLPDKRLVWDFDVYIAHSDRLGFLFARMWDVFDAKVRSEGAVITLSRINGFNSRSINSHLRLGAQIVGRALFFQFGRLQLMVASQSPYLHLAWSGRAKLYFEFDRCCTKV
jgi:hypothetical protein